MNIKKVLVANRGEIAIRVLRSCSELNMQTVAIFTYEDRYSQHRYKADESYQIGSEDEPLKPYLDIEAIVALAVEKDVDAIHPGYGFLSENKQFAQACKDNGIIFVGPEPRVIERLGDKITAKKVANKCNVPVIESSKEDLISLEIAISEAKRIGYPVMLKAAAGGGGRGMRIIRSESDMSAYFDGAKSEALKGFGDDTMFIEKYVENPKHVEVQIVADNYGNVRHLFERDCSTQRRHQKVVEVAPSYNVSEEVKNKLYDYSIRLAKEVNYNNVGTVEFLVNSQGEIFFLEVNPRIQVEHTVTEMVTAIDLIRTQILIAAGFPLDSEQISIGEQNTIECNGFAIQCRITTEDPENNFTPDYGTITTYRHAGGNGIRLDEGSVYQGVRISPFFDSMLVKISAGARTIEGARRKMTRALGEFRIRGVKTNIHFLQNVINHPEFLSGAVNVNFIQNTPELFEFKHSKDRATKIISYLGEVIVNGHPDVKVVDHNKVFRTPKVPAFDSRSPFPKGTKDLLTELGPEKFCEWLKNEKQIHYTDTTLRDAHQSLLATRMRSYDMLKVTESFAKNHPNTFSMEVWGGATFDVCLRFLNENPWKRLRDIRAAAPNILLQMLFRSSNAVGYTAYPDNLIEQFIIKSAENGMDIFRIFDSLNWVKAMEPSIRYVREKTNSIAEGCISYTGDILDKNRTKYDLRYYLQMAKDLENAGAHIICIKDMAGLLKPYAATELINGLRDTVKLPIHLHTHDTSSIQSATYLKAIEANVDVIDVALGGLSGLTSQPNFNAMVEMTRFQERHNEFNIQQLNEFSRYWEDVRELYYPFECGLKAGTADVYHHEIPGGQYSNLRPQVDSLGLTDRFDEVIDMYRQVNDLFGDVVKVTPSSKVVGDMANFMVASNLTPEDVLSKGNEISFPESVISFFKGDLGQPDGGFPAAVQRAILKDIKPYTERPNEHMKPLDIQREYEAFENRFQKNFPRPLELEDYLSYALYPKVFKDAHAGFIEYGDVSTIPTKNYFYGMDIHEEIMVKISEGKTILIKLLSVGAPNNDGRRTVFFKVNGQNRSIEVVDKSLKIETVQNRKANTSDSNEIPAPLPGRLIQQFFKIGDAVKENDPLFVVEAMKMENIVRSQNAGIVKDIVLTEGAMVKQDDLVLILA